MKVAFSLLICLWACGGLPLCARDLAAYRVGEVAAEDVMTPVALDVVDPAATAALQATKAQQFPAIFRSYAEATNVMAGNFLAAFAEARSNFLAAAAAEFHAGKLEEAAIGSAAFSRLVTAFGVEHKNFPVPDDLAAEWARGRDGEADRDHMVATLLWAANARVRPDGLPPGMFVGETVRLVPVSDPGEKLAFETVLQGRLVPAASLTTVSNVQAQFRREFPPERQLFARALAAFLQPNCFPDAPFTQLTRGAATVKVVVSDHFDPGDAIVRRGDAIDAKAMAALEALNEKMAAKPVALPVATANVPPAAPAAVPQEPKMQPVTAQPPQVSQASQAPQAPVAAILPAPAAVRPNPAGASGKAEARPGGRHWGMIAALAGMSVAWLLVAWWQYSKQRKKAEPPPVAAAQVPLPLAEAPKDTLTPQVTQAVREAVQQELTMQRRELLVAQQAATSEIAALVQRLDELQVPMQQRLQTYESRIQALEKELALRNEENRELLKLKIEMVTRQLATERAALVPPMPV